MSKPLTRDIIHRELIRLGNVSFRHSYWFKHSKGIKIKIHRLKKKLRSKGYSKEDIKKHVNDLTRKEDKRIYRKVIKILTELLYNLAQGKEHRIRLNKIPYYKKWYLEKYLHFLIHKGMIRAIYVGPLPKDMEARKCRNVRSINKDPWHRDPCKSGALKMWLFYTTGNKSLREKRLKCWAPYIVIDFSPLIAHLFQDK